MQMKDIKVGETYRYREGKYGLSGRVRVLETGVWFNARNPRGGVRVERVRDNGEAYREEVVLGRWIRETVAQAEVRNRKIREEMDRRREFARQNWDRLAKQLRRVDEFAAISYARSRYLVLDKDKLEALVAAGFATQTEELSGATYTYVLATFDPQDAMVSGSVPVSIAASLASLMEAGEPSA